MKQAIKTSDQSETLTLGPAAHGGYCVARAASGKVVMVRGGLPGEQVTVQYLAHRSKVSYAQVTQVLQASSQRREPIWPQAVNAGLGGVELGHVSPEGQKEWKRTVLVDCIGKLGSEQLATDLQQVWNGEVIDVGYEPQGRTRVEFTVNDQGQPAMFQANSQNLVEIDQMPLAVAQLTDLGIFGASAGQWQFLAGSRLRAVCPSASGPVLVIDGQTYSAPGKPASTRVLERINAGGEELTYRVYAQSFWQAHRRAPAALIDTLAQMLDHNVTPDVFELYSGSGLFTLWLAKTLGQAADITAWEGSGPAVKSARYNLERFAPGVGVRQKVRHINEKTLAGVPDLEGYLVLADPPRAGLGKKAMATICAKRPLLIALISCDPAAGSRDLEAARQAGYQLTDFRLLDLFPYTHHMETISILRRP